MKKTVIAPGQGTIESDVIDEPQISLAVATHHDTHTHVEINGLVYPEGDVREQTRQMLGLVEKILEDLEGSMHDIVKFRWFVREDVLDDETRGTIHEVRSDFIDYPHYPASCMVGVASHNVEGALVELEVRATIPTDGEWTVERLPATNNQ
ncbi:RidA family protein [Natronosalvus caseinilyticus]|uniref:RidA family protein n=1 Tax=Natronosalvus caseinilyticus TaxID=2953747 RepID=UPI0028AB3C9F|nr:RidA family protein [Natronosalvus caseinilyticus]